MNPFLKPIQSISSINVKRILMSIISVTTAIAAGICLFIIATTFDINGSWLNASFHQNLFEKNNIYSHTDKVINTSIKEFISSQKKFYPENFEQHKDVFSLFENSVTPELIKTNLDNVRDGLFEYFKGERRFLPDILLSPSKSSSPSSVADTVKTASGTLSKIDKINLSVVLLYINRNDIVDMLSLMKFIYYVLSIIPGFSLLIFLLLSLIGLVLCHKLFDVTKWIGTLFLSCASASLIASLSLFIYSYFVMPKNIEPVSMSLPLQPEIIISYIRDCTNHTSIFLGAVGLSFILLSILLFCIPRFLHYTFRVEQDKIQKLHPSRRALRNFLYIFTFILIITAIGYKFYTLKKDFEANDFDVIISRVRSVNTVTKIIPAKNDVIYALHVKLLDSKTNAPIKNTQININGKSGNDLNQTASTDSDGTAKFTLDKGTFRLSFISYNFPQEYNMPSPFFVDLKSIGTTIITVNLDASEASKQKWGIVEVEVLDKDNKPVPNLELATQGLVLAPGYPNNIFSYTNSEGIAVFKVNEGACKINFTGSKFPAQYQIPPYIDASVVPDAVTRYTIRLVDAKINIKE